MSEGATEGGGEGTAAGDEATPAAGGRGPGAGKKLRRTILLVGVAVLLVAVGVVIVASRGQGASTTLRDNFDLPQLSGPGRVRLAAYRGQPVVVTLFASWCDNCIEELPAFATVARSLGPRVAFIGVNSLETGNGLAMAQRFNLAGSGFALARDVGPGLSNYHDALGALGMPATAFYSRQGQLLHVDQGGMTAQALQAAIQHYFALT
ncbi:MAG: TlpA family protein disulfide reductase [Acidimicrobiales bacterium]